MRKFDEIGDEVKEHEMPLSSYTLIHKNAELTAEEQTILINWAVASKASIDTVKTAEEPKK